MSEYVYSAIKTVKISLTCMLLMACSTPLQQPLPKGQQTLADFPKIENSFTRYQHKVALYLSQNSLAQRTEQQIAYNQPFQLKASKAVTYQGRFLLIHGLNDSPFVWRDFANTLVERGFDVRAILLEGHGSHPKKMLDVSAKQWIKSVQAHFDAWQREASDQQSPIYIGGFSLGAVLATNLAIDNPDIAGLFLVSPAFHSKLNNLLSFSWLYRLVQPWLFGTMLDEDNPSKYNSISINSGAAYYATTQRLKANWLKPLNIPVLMVHTVNDSVVDVSYSRKMFSKNFTADKELLLFAPFSRSISSKDTASQNQNTLLTSPTGISLKPFEVLQNSYYPQKRILNQSHLSLINRADNPLLGEHNGQLICNGNEYAVFMACMRASNHWYGAQHTASPDSDAVARTTYNPDYSKVVERFEHTFMK